MIAGLMIQYHWWWHLMNSLNCVTNSTKGKTAYSELSKTLQKYWNRSNSLQKPSFSSRSCDFHRSELSHRDQRCLTETRVVSRIVRKFKHHILNFPKHKKILKSTQYSSRTIISRLIDHLIFIDLSCLTWIRVVSRRPGLSHESMKVENSWSELQKTSKTFEIGPIVLKCGPKTWIHAKVTIFFSFELFDHHLMSDSEL